MFHENYQINNLCLIVINDGNGDQCGASYPERVRLTIEAESSNSGTHYAYDWAWNAYNWSLKRGEKYSKRERSQIIAEVAYIVHKYYVQHVKESAQK